MARNKHISLKQAFTITWGVILLVAGWMGLLQRDENWSNQMQIRKSLGFDSQLSSPLVAAQLASSPADLAQVFGRDIDSTGNLLVSLPTKPAANTSNKPSNKSATLNVGQPTATHDPLIEAMKRDARHLSFLLGLDYVFIAFYGPMMALFAAILHARGGLPSRRLIMATYTIIALTVVADVVENHHARQSLNALAAATVMSELEALGGAEPNTSLNPEGATPAPIQEPRLDPTTINVTRRASLIKWMGVALLCIVLAWGSANHKGLRASITALLLVGGGSCILVGVYMNKTEASHIEIGFAAASLGALASIGVVHSKPRANRVPPREHAPPSEELRA